MSRLRDCVALDVVPIGSDGIWDDRARAVAGGAEAILRGLGTDHRTLDFSGAARQARRYRSLRLNRPTWALGLGISFRLRLRSFSFSHGDLVHTRSGQIVQCSASTALRGAPDG